MNSAVSCDDLPEALERRAVLPLAIHELGVVDRVRLLPDQERADARRRLGAARVGHLRPARARVALARRRRARARQDPRRSSRGCARAAARRPQSAKCAACHQCISRWNLPYQLLKVSPVSCGGVAAGALDRGQVLRQHDAPLELAPARVAAPREVDRRRPWSRSAFQCSRARRRASSKLGGSIAPPTPPAGAKPADELERVAAGPRARAR